MIDCAQDNGIYIVCFPSHSTRKMQRLEFSFMQPLKTYYAQEIQIWLRAHPDRVVTRYQISGLVGKAYLK